MIKKAFTYLLISFCSLAAWAQTADSTLYRSNKVKEVNSWVYVHGFIHKKDTCLSTTKRYNTSGMPTYIKTDYGCQGWNVQSEITYTYDEQMNLVGLQSVENNEIRSKIVYEVDSFNRVVSEVNTFLDPRVVVTVANTYFGDSRQPDSMWTTTITDLDTAQDTSITRTTYTYIGDKLKKSNTKDATSGKAVSMLTNKFDAKGRLIREEFIYFLGYDSDNITKFEYNEKGQIAMTKSELDEIAARFYYDREGLPALTHYYNKFGSLEREVFHKYTYYE